MAHELLKRLVAIYRGEAIRHPQLRAVSLAQWMLESGRGDSRLAQDHYNFGGLKWRKEMTPFATKVSYGAHDGQDFYCKFATLENFIAGYWAFLNRAPYSGWESHVATPQDFIGFIGPIYTPTPGYAAKVLALLPEATRLLEADDEEEPAPARTVRNLGAIIIDPGHGGTAPAPGSSPNNAISVSGVKEKKLTLDFALILKAAMLRQAAERGEQVKVVLTRETDINLAGSARAGLALTHKAKLFLCIHFNGSANASVRGVETFYRARENGNTNLAADMAFAGSVHGALFGALKALDAGTKDRGLKPDTQTNPGALGVLNDKLLGNDRRGDPCLSAYLEVEFITNRAVETLLISGPAAVANRTKAMEAVAKACLEQMRAMG